MNNLVYFSGWKPELCIQLNAKDNPRADFNRLLFKECPSTLHILQGHAVIEIPQRHNFILKCKFNFDEKIEQGISHETIRAIFGSLIVYVNWCDTSDFEAFTKASLEAYMDFLQAKLDAGILKKTTYINQVGAIHTLFNDYLKLPISWFLSVDIDREKLKTTEPYSKNELKIILPFLRQLFKQTSSEFLANPKIYLSAYKHQNPMLFRWKGKDYKLCALTSKMMTAAFLLCKYYIFPSSSGEQLFSLKRYSFRLITNDAQILKTSAFNKRKVEFVRVHVNELEYFDIPKWVKLPLS